MDGVLIQKSERAEAKNMGTVRATGNMVRVVRGNTKKANDLSDYLFTA